MRKYLLPHNVSSYKANLHTHTSLSDGEFTPEEVKRLYKEQGYSIVAFTDHDIFLTHNDLSDEGFLALNGYEMEVNEEENSKCSFDLLKTCHMCLIALKSDMVTPVCWHRSKYLFGNAPKSKDLIKNDESLSDYERAYTHERISDMMRLGRENGFFVTYNHPTWSMEDYTNYSGYENMHAMEIVNYGCVVAGFADHNERVYDDILGLGKRIYCLATDDCHHLKDMFGGATVIKAKSLDYESIANALVNGDFYATEGPEIKELYIEDGKLYVKTSGVANIRLNTGIRYAKEVFNQNGTEITGAVFDLPENYHYFRVTATDGSGRCAYTNAYFADQLG